jgi:hypothetical protein
MITSTRFACGSRLAAGILLAACGRPDLKTDLDSEGPPEVQLVAVPDQSAVEVAAFCATTGLVNTVCDGYSACSLSWEISRSRGSRAAMAGGLPTAMPPGVQ